uniref:Uncharacterized protein n=1 Tax=Romanomermis culicivorax TaxID=13658 RepID=A0A915IND0_ROMCU
MQLRFIRMIHWMPPRTGQNDNYYISQHSLAEVVPADLNAVIYPTLSQIVLPAIMQDKVLLAYYFLMYDCTLTDLGWSVCLGTQLNGFRDIKTLMRTIPLKLLTVLKMPKKKKKKQCNEWNQSSEISDEEDPSLLRKKIYDDPKCLQSAIALAMKSSHMTGLNNLLSFPVSPIFKLEVRTCLDAEKDLPLPTNVHDVWIEQVVPYQPHHDRTYHGTHYHYLPNTLLTIFQVDSSWLNKMTVTMPLTMVIASPCSTAKFAYVNDLLAQHEQMLDGVPRTLLYKCMWFHADGNPHARLTDWMNHIPEHEPAFGHNPENYICNHFALHPIIFDEDLGIKVNVIEIEINETNYTSNPHSRFHMYSHLFSHIDFYNQFSFPVPF